jgi:hypothetical protein
MAQQSPNKHPSRLRRLKWLVIDLLQQTISLYFCSSKVWLSEFLVHGEYIKVSMKELVEVVSK